MMFALRGFVPRILLAISLVIAVSTPAVAADTGSVLGTVFDERGEPLDGATVTIRGEGLPAGRAAHTGANGSFRFDRLLPGDYTIEAASAALAAITRAASVEVDKDTQVDVVIGLTVAEA